MKDFRIKRRVLAGLSVTAATVVVACGGGSQSAQTPSAPTGVTGRDDSAAAIVASAGLWKGTLTDASAGRSEELIGLVDAVGESIWMTPAGRALDGAMPRQVQATDVQLRMHDYDRDRLGEGTGSSGITMRIEQHSQSHIEGHFHDPGSSSFRVERHPAWERRASLAHLSGVYTRSLRSGYTMTISITATGELTGSDTWGCLLNGTVGVPDPMHNLYRIDVEASSCGLRDGVYHGLGALLDGSAMQDWIAAMQPFEHGGPHGTGGHMQPGTVLPGGEQNLLVFGVFNERHVILDTLAR